MGIVGTKKTLRTTEILIRHSEKKYFKMIFFQKSLCLQVSNANRSVFVTFSAKRRVITCHEARKLILQNVFNNAYVFFILFLFLFQVPLFNVISPDTGECFFLWKFQCKINANNGKIPLLSEKVCCSNRTMF